MKFGCLLICLFFSFLAVFAQDLDSIVFVNARWEKQSIGKNTTLLTHHFNNQQLFKSNQQISYLLFKNTGKKIRPAFAAEPKTLKKTSDFGKSANAIGAINGNFFDTKNGGSVDYVRVNGLVVNETRLEKNNARAFHQKAAVLIKEGKLSIEKWDGQPFWETAIEAENVLLSGPLLTYHSVIETLDTIAFNTTRHPRSVVGIKRNGTAILLTVDGRNEQSAGMSLFELTKIMRWLGCTSVLNLDGGGSTTLWINKPNKKDRVVNYPSDNKIWDHEGERAVANIIYLKKH